MGKPLDIMAFSCTHRPGGRTDGVWVPAAAEPYTLNASRPQPVGPEVLEQLDEGARSTARFIIYAEDTEPEVYLVGRDREGYSTDLVAYDGDIYEVTTIDNWASMPLGYHAYILLHRGPDE